MAVKLELYRVFKEVADTGNISAAAKNLYISQSAVSQSIKQLESSLQARLFARSPRGVTLTSEGQMLYQYVRSALGLLATGEDKLTQAQRVFDALRTFDNSSVTEIYAQCPDNEGLGLAIGNRLKKAAGFHVHPVPDNRRQWIPHRIGCEEDPARRRPCPDPVPAALQTPWAYHRHRCP